MNRSGNTIAGVAARQPSGSKRRCLGLGRGGDEAEVEKSIVWMDAEAQSLDCSICFLPFQAEVFMCQNGHAACGECCVRTNRRCSCCREPIGDVRCRPLENILAEMNTHCKFSEFGCASTVRYTDKRRHEETCRHAPCDCPVDGCDCRARGEDMYVHLLECHSEDDAAYLQPDTEVKLGKGTPFRVLVAGCDAAAAGEGSRVFVLLNGGGVAGFRSLSLVCLGPQPEGSNGQIRYKLEVRGGGAEPAADALSLTATAPCVRKLEDIEEANLYLVVPEAVWGPSGTVSVRICFV
ncbi:unnamed protein product [Urochloa humidicola]